MSTTTIINRFTGVRLLAILLVMLPIIGCMQEPPVEKEEPRAEDAVSDLLEALDEAGETVRDALGGEESVDYRALEEILPNEVAGLDRVEREGGRTQVMGMSFSAVSVKYAYADQSIEIDLADLGSLTSLVALGATEWLETDINRESDRGFERTREYRQRGNTYPSYEKVDGDHCEIQICVADRFIISIEGKRVSMDLCEEARDEIDFRELERIKKKAEAKKRREQR